MMLQQTQVNRVLDKFVVFVERFPDFRSLAKADLYEVLEYWSGLGYNRRAKFLKDSAVRIVDEHNGVLPEKHEDLVALPGIGNATASAVLTYSFNQPNIFIETNIRQVIIYHFFPESEAVDDREIEAVLKQIIDTENPRLFYWAMMDYGTYLKKTAGNLTARSKHYKKQSSFKGSKRQIRGEILRQLLQKKMLFNDIFALFPETKHDVREILDKLIADEMITLEEDYYTIV